MSPTNGMSVTFTSKVKTAMKNIDKAQKKRATEAGIRGRRAVVEKLTGTRTGREYTVPGTGVTYTASAPGEPPAQRTGTLRGSIAYETESTVGGYNAIIGSPEKYAPVLEYGALLWHGGEILPRPFMRPALVEIQGELMSIMSGRWF